MAVFAWLQTQISKQVGQVFPWSAVFFGGGIWLYFSLRFEPSLPWILSGMAIAAIWAAIILRYRYVFGLIYLFPALIMVGYSSAALQARLQAAPVLEFRYYGPIYGRVVQIDRSSSHALRLTLDHVQLSNVAPEDIPHRVRVSLHGSQGWLESKPGQYVGMKGHLSAPNGPVEPRGFDFQRHAWFLKLGAVGYTRTPVLEMKPPNSALLVDQLRRRIALYVADYLGGDVGGFAAAVTTGDRSAFSQEAIEALRVSNLAHLLAISGLHMGLLAGFLFGSFRVVLSVWQPLALRLPVKRIAACAALLGATGYLMLSGASIATQRAFIMAAVALVAVSIDRRALTLRAVAIAALIVLLLRPWSILSPGFQMSFAATTALVWVFSGLRDLPKLGPKRWQRSVLTLFISSTVAGLATAPFAAAHFNQWAAYGLIANLAAVPVMGMIVIPSAVLAAVLSPVGLEWIGLDLMGIGLRWILLVANWVSGLDGARVPVVTPQPIVLPLICLAGIWLVLWQGSARWAGCVVFAVAGILWVQTERPDVLISEDGKLIGVMTKDGRALSKEKGQGFVASSWLENDGDELDQTGAALRIDGPRAGVFAAQLGKQTIVHFQGKKGNAQVSRCMPDEIFISDQSIDEDWDCFIFDQERLKSTGATALWIDTNGSVTVQTVADMRGKRLWSPAAQTDQ